MTSVFAGQDALAAPNDPLVTVDDFTEWYSLSSPTTQDTNRIQTALEIASAEIRLNRRLFDPVNGDVATIDGSGRQSIVTPRNRLPVRNITQITQLLPYETSFTTLASAEYDWDEEGIIRLTRTGRYAWTDRLAGVKVTYDHGYLVLPREVAGICLIYARRLFLNPGGQLVESETIGDVTVDYGHIMGGLLDSEKEILRQYEVTR